MAETIKFEETFEYIWQAAKDAQRSSSFLQGVELRKLAKNELSDLLASRDAEIARLRGEVERLKSGEQTTPKPFTNPTEAIARLREAGLSAWDNVDVQEWVRDMQRESYVKRHD